MSKKFEQQLAELGITLTQTQASRAWQGPMLERQGSLP